MARCRHEHKREDYWNGVLWIPLRDFFRHRPAISRVVCRACGHWLPLGPADDDSPEVRVEMRAAELALDPLRGAGMDDSHCYHWFDGEGPCCRCGDDSDPSPEDLEDAEYCAVGDLAHVIATHDETTNTGETP